MLSWSGGGATAIDSGAVGQTIEVEGLSGTGVKTRHGPVALRLGCFTRTLSPGPGERIGWGAIGFLVRLDGQRVVNLGDRLLEREAWKGTGAPEVLMAPIGGTTVAITMKEGEALEAARAIRPRIVIP